MTVAHCRVVGIETAVTECTEVEVIGPPRHHVVVVRALEEAGLACRWVQPLRDRGGDLHDVTLLIHATGSARLVAQVVGQLQMMHPRLRVAIDGDC